MRGGLGACFCNKSGLIRFTDASGQKGPVAAAQRYNVAQHVTGCKIEGHLLG